MNDLKRIGIQCDKAISSSNQRDIRKLVKKLERVLENDTSRDYQCYIYYFLGNLYSRLSSLLEEKVSGWRNDNYPESLTAEINHFRQAEKLLSEDTKGIKNEVRTNLANALARQRRSIEILDYWKCDFNIQGDAPFVSTLSKAQELLWLSLWLNDCNHAHIYQYEAYLLIKKLQSNVSKTSHQEIIKSLKNNSSFCYSYAFMVKYQLTEEDTYHGTIQISQLAFPVGRLDKKAARGDGKNVIEQVSGRGSFGCD